MYLDEDYLKLFKQVQEEDKTKVEVKNYDFEFLKQNATNLNETSQLIREVPNYNNFQNYNQPPKQNLNEVNRSNEMGNLNEFVTQTTFNGQNLNEIRRIEKQEKLNEILQQRETQRLNEIKQHSESIGGSVNEVVDFKNADVVSVAMFNKALFNSMITVFNERKSEKK